MTAGTYIYVVCIWSMKTLLRHPHLFTQFSLSSATNCVGRDWAEIWWDATESVAGCTQQVSQAEPKPYTYRSRSRKSGKCLALIEAQSSRRLLVTSTAAAWRKLRRKKASRRTNNTIRVGHALRPLWVASDATRPTSIAHTLKYLAVS